MSVKETLSWYSIFYVWGNAWCAWSVDVVKYVFVIKYAVKTRNEDNKRYGSKTWIFI